MSLNDISKKIFGFNLDYLVKGGFWLTLLQIILYLVGLGITIAFTHLSSKYTYGQYSLVMSVLGTISAFSLLGMNIAIAQSTARGYFYSLIEGTLSKIKWSLLGTLSLLLTSIYFFYVRRDDGLWLIFIMAAVAFPFLYGFEGIIYYFNGRQQFKNLALGKILMTGIPLLGLFIALFITVNILYILGVFFCLVILTSLLTYFFVARKIKETRRDNELKSYGKHLSFLSGLTRIANYLDHLIVAYFLGYTTLAIFTIANIIPKQLKILGKIISNLYLPKFSIVDGEKIKVRMKKNLVFVAGISLIISIIGALVLPFLINLLFTNAYEEAILFSQILFLGAFVTIPNSILVGFFQAQKRKKELYKYNISTSLVKIMLFVVLIPFFGLWGAIMGMLISRFFNVGYNWYLFSR